MKTNPMTFVQLQIYSAEFVFFVLRLVENRRAGARSSAKGNCITLECGCMNATVDPLPVMLGFLALLFSMTRVAIVKYFELII